MAENDLSRNLALTLRHSFGDLLSFPLLQPSARGPAPARSLILLRQEALTSGR